MVKEIQSSEEFEQLIAGSEPVVVDFWATWCGPCKLIGPHFGKLEDKYPGVKFCKIDIEELPEVAKAQNITAMPTFKAYKDGNSIGEIVGAVPAKLTALLDSVSGQSA